MLIKLSGGKVYDPAHQIDGKVMDIYIRDGRIVARPRDDEKIDQTYCKTSINIPQGNYTLSDVLKASK